MEAFAVLCLGIGLGMAVVAFVFLAKQFLFVGRPNELLIFSGREYTDANGKTRGYRVIHGGFSWRIPLLEKVDRMMLTTCPSSST